MSHECPEAPVYIAFFKPPLCFAIWRRFFETGDKSGIVAAHEKKLKIILQRLSGAVKSEDMHTPGIQFHKLTGNFEGFYSVSVSVNWRIIFKFNGQDVEGVNYVDYH